MGKIIGIDLGTTNSCVSVMEGSEAKVIMNREGGRTTPSVMAVSENGERLVGQIAKRQATTNPENTILIEKNTTIPIQKSEVFSTAKDNQSAVSIQVLQGEREMALDNKPLARFELVGIPPTPRGLPQIKVTFDIDANGIVNVSAKDTATGKEQSIQITSSSGLSKKDVDRLIKDAELHAEEDQKKKAQVDARNTADALIHATEKTLADMGGKVDGTVRMEVEDAISNLKQAVKDEETQAMVQKTEHLNNAAHKLTQGMYEQSSDPENRNHGNGHHTGSSFSAETDEEVVDAEFEEVA